MGLSKAIETIVLVGVDNTGIIHSMPSNRPTWCRQVAKHNQPMGLHHRNLNNDTHI